MGSTCLSLFIGKRKPEAWLIDLNESFQNDRLAILVSFILLLLEVKSDENEKRRRVDTLST